MFILPGKFVLTLCVALGFVCKSNIAQSLKLTIFHTMDQPSSHPEKTTPDDEPDNALPTTRANPSSAVSLIHLFSNLK